VAHAAVDGARDAGATVVVDPAPADRLSDDLLRRADHVTPDHLEAAQLTGHAIESVEDGLVAAERLRARGAGAAYVKLPGGGCAVTTYGSQESYPDVERLGGVLARVVVHRGRVTA